MIWNPRHFRPGEDGRIDRIFRRCREARTWVDARNRHFEFVVYPLKRRLISHVKMYNLATRKLHDDKDVENPKCNGMLHKKVATPHCLGLVLQKASPLFGIPQIQLPLDHVSAYSGGGVVNVELNFELQGNAIFAILRVI